MIETALLGLGVVVGVPICIVAAGFIYAKVVGYDEVQTVEDAVAEAQERRND